MATDFAAPPHPRDIERALRLLEPWRLLTTPAFYGLENIPATGPVLLVGNHTLFGMLDTPLMVAEIYERRGLFLRGLGDHLHFKVPVWRDFLSRFGAVDGTRENCTGLLRAGQAVLVFPGGAREVAKRKGEKYKLIWKERLGFARMAIDVGCPVVPFAAVGAEETYDIVVDGNDILASPLGAVLRQLGLRPDAILPIARGMGGGILPRPEKFYFWFGGPHDAARFRASGAGADAGARELRDLCRADIEHGIKWLHHERKRDPRRGLVPRVIDGVKRLRTRTKPR